MVKIYYSLWALTALALALLIATANFTMMTAVVFGFITFGLTFMGLIAVLPVWACHTPEPKPAKVKDATLPLAVPAKANAYGVLKSA